MSNNFQSNNKSKMNSSSKMGSCKVCIAAGKADFNHFVKNLDGTTNCPTLLSQSCRYCKEPGHTTKYCPVLAQHKKEDDMLLRRASNATIPSITKTMIKPSFTSANAFSALDSDEETQSSKKMTTTKSSQQIDSRVQTNIGNKHSTTIKTNNFSITGSSKAKQEQAEAFPSLPKSDKPNYAAIAAKAEANERAQKEKDAKEAKLREEQASLIQITGLAGQKVTQDTTKPQVVKQEYPTMLTTEELADFTTCGDYIYDYIELSHKLMVDSCKKKGINIPIEQVQELLSAGRITGIIMELEHAEVIELIKNPTDLNNRIAEAIEVINKDKLEKINIEIAAAKAGIASAKAKPIAVAKRSGICTWADEESDDEDEPTDNSAWD
jgi:hypothetical protein